RPVRRDWQVIGRRAVGDETRLGRASLIHQVRHAHFSGLVARKSAPQASVAERLRRLLIKLSHLGVTTIAIYPFATSTIRSPTERATTYRAGFSPTASALKCALPHSILALSLSRRSSVNRLLLVSTTKYRCWLPSSSTSTAQSGL